MQSFKIFPLGFMVSFKIDTKNYNKKVLKGNLLVLKKIFVAAAGPLTNILIIFIVLLLRRDEIFNIKTDLIVYSNVLIFIFNMLPIYPLDGGRILKNILHIFLGKINSLKSVNLISNICAIFLSMFIIYLTIVAQNISYIFALIYVWILIIRENKRFKLKIKIYEYLNLYIK